MRDPELHTTGYYHVFNRGTDKRSIFEKQIDYLEFYEGLYLYSDKNYQNPEGRFMIRASELAGSEVYQMDRDPLVKILSFNLVGNHYHLFLQQLQDGGISKFIHRLQKTYSLNFNNRNDRKGTLFESSFKARHIDNDAYFLHISRYIHLNALDLQFPEWREGWIKDWKSAEKVLNSHRWSSHHTYLEKPQSLPLIDESFIKSQFPTIDIYMKFLSSWAGSGYMQDLPDR